MSDTEEDTPREHNEANQENKLHEKKSDTITWKYKKNYSLYYYSVYYYPAFGYHYINVAILDVIYYF